MKRLTGKMTILVCFFCMLFLFLITGCGKEKEEKNQYHYKVYYVNHDRTCVISEDYVTENTDVGSLLEELVTQLGTVPEKLQYHAPLAGSFELLSMQLKDGQLILDFNTAYREQEMITEILNRASIVRTLSQVKDVQYVSFLVEGEPLVDASGSVVGVMSADTFIDNAGNEINTYEKVKLQLYFADEDGTGLQAVSRTKVYNSNISLERLVMEELIAGPQADDTGLAAGRKDGPVINPATKIVSVAVRDGICYVNLDDSFLNQIYNVTPEVTIYAIANSLIELTGVNKVQISVNGETSVNYRENINLSTVFERNLDMVK